MSGAAEPRLDLNRSTVLLVQANEAELGILGQVFIGFGVKGIRKCMTVRAAEEAARSAAFDLIVVDAEMRDSDGRDLVRTIRRLEDNPNRLTPILVVCGHAAMSLIAEARDSGANFVVAKPIMPKAMFDRLIWLAREERAFIECETYVGPDRRHKAFGPPVGMKGRRHDDLSEEVGDPVGPDMCQAEIDAMLNPKRAVA